MSFSTVATESVTKLSVRAQIPGGASSLSENVSNTILAEFSDATLATTYPEYITSSGGLPATGSSQPSWVDDVVLHSAAAPGTFYGTNLVTRLQCRQITTQTHETQIYGEPSPYGPPPQIEQINFRKWQN